MDFNQIEVVVGSAVVLALIIAALYKCVKGDSDD